MRQNKLNLYLKTHSTSGYGSNHLVLPFFPFETYKEETPGCKTLNCNIFCSAPVEAAQSLMNHLCFPHRKTRRTR